MPSAQYAQWVKSVKGLEKVLARLYPSHDAAAVASALEFVLEGLHLSRRLNKDRAAQGMRYRR